MLDPSENKVTKALSCATWLPGCFWQSMVRPRNTGYIRHVIVALTDHFEPSIVAGGAEGVFAPLDKQFQRLEEWCRLYPRVMDPYRDADGVPFRHTYFYPAEQYVPEQISLLAEHCHRGWGEIEIHLHHGIDAPDTSANTRSVLTCFRDALAERGCLSYENGTGMPRYAFIHGNWALANVTCGRDCGVDDEMQILAETGCYADFTLPSAPGQGQIAKVNSLYECALPLDKRAPQRRGRDLTVGRAPTVFPVIVQGPLSLNMARGQGGRLAFKIENSEVSSANPPTAERFRRWLRAGITVRHRPDWVFVKLHCHGMDPRDREVMLGAQRRAFLEELQKAADQGRLKLHFVTAREMFNMILAACEGKEGDPGAFRDYRLRLGKQTTVSDHGRVGVGRNYDFPYEVAPRQAAVGKNE